MCSHPHHIRIRHIHICIHIHFSKYHVEKHMLKKNLHNSEEEKNREKTNYMSDFNILLILKAV